jgi:hypothetical protein
MVQYRETVLDASFAGLSDATWSGVREQLGRADASITDLAGEFHMTRTGMKKHAGFWTEVWSGEQFEQLDQLLPAVGVGAGRP